MLFYFLLAELHIILPERMNEERLMRRIGRSEVNGVRPRGTPHLGLMDSVRRALNERGLTVEQGRAILRE